MRNRNPWAEAHLKLKRLYEERVPPNMTQRDFGKRYGIGSQSMVAQYLNGDRPLNFEAAAKFSKGLGCTIYDICPDMVEEILPVLGKTWRRAATVLLCLLIPTLQAPDAKAAGFDITFTEYTLRALRRWLLNVVKPQYSLTN
jgi:transcriptional regulator with XRE-family HTH domain